MDPACSTMEGAPLTSARPTRRIWSPTTPSSTSTVFLAAVLLMSLASLVHNLRSTMPYRDSFTSEVESASQAMVEAQWSSLLSAAQSSASSTSNSNSDNSTDLSWDALNPLAIPPGEAPALPSIRIEDAELDKKRKIYGGAGDAVHLGGLTQLDLDGVSPTVWKNLIEQWGVHSLLDVGCGKGVSTVWFALHGARVLCVEGSHDAVQQTLLPNPATQVVEHDYSRGPYWPAQTYDAVWAVEFLEHVSVHFQFNYLMTFRKAALVLCTASRWGGWHHVEVHDDIWWKRKFAQYGLQFSVELTQQVRRWAQDEQSQNIRAPNGKNYNAQHIWLTMNVFINPMVAALPQHAHLFPELGCFDSSGDDEVIKHRECGTGPQKGMETPLDPSFRPLVLTPNMHEAWEDLLRLRLNLTAPVVNISKQSVST